MAGVTGLALFGVEALLKVVVTLLGPVGGAPALKRWLRGYVVLLELLVMAGRKGYSALLWYD